ncbi:50S ribosomal protein L19, partial [Candidatus Margulisiibacteriota bacterium]
MKEPIIANIENKQLKENLPKFNIGDTIKVFSKIVEGGKSRVQAYEGTVIAINKAGARTTFTVRKVVSKIGVEKT